MSDDRSIPTSDAADLPTLKVLVDGAQISPEFQVQTVVVTRHFNRVADAEILILDGDVAAEEFKASNAEEFLPGKEIEVRAGYHGNEERIFLGLIVRHGLRIPQNRPAVLRVECRDAAVKLTVGRKSAYFHDMKDSEIIEQIAGEHSLESDIEATDVTHSQMVQFYATDWDFLVTRAEANGKLIHTDDGKLIVRAPDPSSDPALNLTFGGNILDFEAGMDARDQFEAVQALSWDPANGEMFEIDGSGASGSPGNVSESDLAAVVGLETLALKHAGQIKDDELQAWADSQCQKSALAKVRGRVRIQGHAPLGPGDTIELGGVGDRFNGRALVSGVRHEINTRNWETDLSFGLSPHWFGAERQDIVQAPANGLLPGIPGLQIGLVTALEGDPDGEHRIQVRTPLIDPAEEGIWARVATLDAGENRGSFWLPEVDDEVLLGFLNDDPRNPVVLGMLNSSAKPPFLEASDDNHEKGFVTRSEMKLLFDDDKKTITVETPNGNAIILSDEDGGITLQDENGNKIVLDGDGITIESAVDLNLTASGDVNVEGINISNAASAQLTSEGSSGAEISSGGSTVIKGSVVQIN